MSSSPLHRCTARWALAACVVVGFTAAPLELSRHFGLDQASAFAKGGKDNDHGGGHGGDHGGGNGGGNSGGNNEASADDTSPGNSANAPGHNKADIETAAAKNDLGSLNSMNSSETAKMHASSNSPVGKLGEYEAALANGDLDAAAAALAGAANKEITADIVAEVNRSMGIESTPEEEAQIADLAEAARTAEPTDGDMAGGEPTDGETTVGDGTTQDPNTTGEDGGAIASAADSLIGSQ